MPHIPRFLRCCACFVLIPAAVFAQTIEGKTIKVIDGDSISIVDAQQKQHAIRINGIDAPERGQAFSGRARENMVHMVAGKEVSADCHKTDPFERSVCTVWVKPDDCSTCGKTMDVGHAQVVAGLAWWFRRYAKEQSPEDRARYEAAENDAKARGIGLWRDPNPTSPWEWRRAKRRSN